MSLEAISIVVFAVFMAILIFLDRKNIEFKYGLLIRKSQRGKKWVYQFAKKHQRKLKMLGNLAVVTGFLAAGYGYYLLLKYSIDIFLRPEEIAQPLKLVLPSVSGVKMPSFVLGVPFWYWILGVFLIMVFHEGMHALLARAEEVPIKNFGGFIFLLIPGAFVDPDENKLRFINPISKLRIYFAGSFGNFVLAAAILILMLGYGYALTSVLTGDGVSFESTIENTGASQAHLNGVILAINNYQVKDMKNFLGAMNNVKPGDAIEIKTTNGLFTVKTTPNPDNKELAFIGIKNPQTVYKYTGLLKQYGYPSETTLTVLSIPAEFFNWVFILSLGVGIFNLFPIKPLDGGLIMEEVVRTTLKGEKANIIVNGITLITLSLVLISLFGPNIIKLL